MSKNIVVLYGKGNCGKTTTLKYLIQSLSDREEISKGDIIAIFSYGNKKIGISTGGDTKSVVYKRVGQLIKAKCDIIIIAARCHGGTHDAIQEIEEQAQLYKTEWFTKIVYDAYTNSTSNLNKSIKNIRDKINKDTAIMLKEHLIHNILKSKRSTFKLLDLKESN